MWMLLQLCQKSTEKGRGEGQQNAKHHGVAISESANPLLPPAARLHRARPAAAVWHWRVCRALGPSIPAPSRWGGRLDGRRMSGQQPEGYIGRDTEGCFLSASQPSASGCPPAVPCALICCVPSPGSATTGNEGGRRGGVEGGEAARHYNGTTTNMQVTVMCRRHVM